MPPNRVVHQLLAGRKRKAKSDGASIRAFSRSSDNENHESVTEKSGVNAYSSTFPPASLSKSDQQEQRGGQKYYEAGNSEQQLVVSPSKIVVSKQGAHITEAYSEPSTDSLPTFPGNMANRKQEREEERDLSKPNQRRIRCHYRRRYVQKSKQREIEYPCNLVDVNMTSFDKHGIDHEQLKETEFLLATRERRKQRGRKSTCTSATPIPLKNSNDGFADLLIKAFLQQRQGKRLTSPNKLLSLSSCPSLIDDQRVFSVLLLGVSALSHVMEWYERKRMETEFSQSQFARELVLWMKDRQELQTVYASETIVKERVDALNQLAQFEQSIQDSHQTSLKLLSQQREEENEIEEKHRKHNFYVEAEERAKTQMKNEPRRFGFNKAGGSQQRCNIYHRLGAPGNDRTEISARMNGTPNADYDHARMGINEVKYISTDAGPKSKTSSYESKNDGGVQYESSDWKIDVSDSIPDDMSEVLLSQSQKHLLRPRRVTVSPRILSHDKAQRSREKYKHYSKINFSGQDQTEGDRRVSDIDFRYSPTKVTRHKSNGLEQPSRLSSRKAWISRAPKRSPTLKQTSLTPSTSGWVSNRRARNFVRNESSQEIPAIKRRISTSHIPRCKNDSAVSKRGLHVQDFDGRDKSPLGTVSISQNNIIGRPTGKVDSLSSFNNAKRTAEQKMPNKEIPSHSNLSVLEQKNKKVRQSNEQYGFHSKVSSEKDDFNGISDFYVSSDAVNADKNDDVVSDYRYEEVVRGKVAREALIGYECKECAAFFDEAVLLGDGAKHYDRDELLRCSRHRARQTPPQTPEDYWELSFADEKAERLKQELGK